MAKPVAGPKRLSIPELEGIHRNHPEIGKAIQGLLEYINKHVVPVPGNRVAPRTPKRVL